jgi:uncharacterized membrane protein YuzA (DUF378 family)
MKALHIIAWILVIIGALNWGLVGLGWLVGGGANWNVVTWICSYIGGMPTEAVVYVLVGLAGVWELIGHRKNCKECSAQ